MNSPKLLSVGHRQDRTSRPWHHKCDASLSVSTMSFFVHSGWSWNDRNLGTNSRVRLVSWSRAMVSGSIAWYDFLREGFGCKSAVPPCPIFRVSLDYKLYCNWLKCPQWLHWDYGRCLRIHVFGLSTFYHRYNIWKSQNHILLVPGEHGQGSELRRSCGNLLAMIASSSIDTLFAFASTIIRFILTFVDICKKLKRISELTRHKCSK